MGGSDWKSFQEITERNKKETRKNKRMKKRKEGNVKEQK